MKNKKLYIKTLGDLERQLRDEDSQRSISQLKIALSEVEEEGFIETERAFPVPEQLKSSEYYAVFSDGACRGNPGPGSWGIMAQNHEGDILFEASSFDQKTTNNKMELLGAQKSLEFLKNYLDENNLQCVKTTVYIFSDSNYVIQGLNNWRHGWKKRGWKKADKKPVENLDLWISLDETVSFFQHVEGIWVKGHSNHPQNERCDQLCNEILDRELF